MGGSKYWAHRGRGDKETIGQGISFQKSFRFPPLAFGRCFSHPKRSKPSRRESEHRPRHRHLSMSATTCHPRAVWVVAGLRRCMQVVGPAGGACSRGQHSDFRRRNRQRIRRSGHRRSSWVEHKEFQWRRLAQEDLNTAWVWSWRKGGAYFELSSCLPCLPCAPRVAPLMLPMGRSFPPGCPPLFAVGKFNAYKSIPGCRRRRKFFDRRPSGSSTCTFAAYSRPLTLNPKPEPQSFHGR